MQELLVRGTFRWMTWYPLKTCRMNLKAVSEGRSNYPSSLCTYSFNTTGTLLCHCHDLWQLVQCDLHWLTNINLDPSSNFDLTMTPLKKINKITSVWRALFIFLSLREYLFLKRKEIQEHFTSILCWRTYTQSEYTYKVNRHPQRKSQT